MSKDEIISNVLDGFFKVQELLGTSDIELCLKTDNPSDPIKKSKEFIDKLFVLSKNIKENFYDLYTKYQKDQNKECEENDTAVPNSILSNGLVSDNSINNDSNEQNDVLQGGTSNVDCSDENMGTLQNDQIEAPKLNSANETDIENIGLSKDQDVETKNIQNQQPQRSLIRLVDLNKLIDPDKHKKSVKFDTSVIILSSSDDENIVINSEINKTRNTSIKQKPECFESEYSNQNEDNDSEKLSDNESDSNCRKSRRLKKIQDTKFNIRERYKKIFNDSKKKHLESSKNKTQVEVISDSSSDSEMEKPQRKSTRTSLGRSCKMDDAKLNSKVSEKLESLRRSKRTRVENETSSDPDKSLKKKTKTFDKEEPPTEIKASKKSLKNRKRGTDKNTGSEGDSDEENSTKKKTKSKKKIDAEENINLRDEGKDLKKKDENKLKDDEIILKKVRFKNDVGKGISELGKEDIDGNKSEDEVEKPVKKSSKDKNDSELENDETSKKRKMNTSKNDSKDLNDEEKADEDKLSKKKIRNKKNATKEQSEEETNKGDTEKKSKADNSDAEEPEGLENEEDPLAVDDPLSTENVLRVQDDNDIMANKEPTNDSSDETLEEGDKNKSDNGNDVNDIDVSNKKDTNVENESKDPKNKKTKNNNDKGDSDDEKKLESDDEATEENKEEKKSLSVSYDEDDDDETNVKTKNNLTVSSDSDEEFGAFSKKRDKSNKDTVKKAKKRIKAVVSDSESGDEENKKNEGEDEENESNSEASKESSKGSEDEGSDGEEENTKKKSTKRSRIRKTKDSSESDEEVETRKNIRKVLGKHSLSETTKQAEADEKERKARIAEKQKKYNRMFEEKKDAKIDKVVLDYDEETKEPALEVHKKIVKNLKPHQASGIQFMYDACFESVERMKNSEGSGCILAHCMGLGKTLQVISLLHTLLVNSKKTKVKKAMVVCPINTVLNWKSEFKKWLPSNSQLEVHELATPKKNYERQYIVSEWHEDGGVLILGYNMFRLLSNPNNKKITKKMRTAFLEGMVDPGPDIVICDEGHLLKNEKTNLSIAMNRIKTARRIVLTGTPLQNNLKEYWCMVQFIKPNLLGTYKEYMNRFVNPITNGQYTDSTRHDTDLMRKRSHVLHKLLDGVVQRRDYAVLEPYLPPKHEYVLFVKLADVQIKLYKHYIEKYARRNDGSNRTSFLFADFQELQRICTHPRVMKDKSIEKKEKWDEEDESEGSLKDFIDDGEVSARSTSSTGSESEGNGNESDSDKKKKKPRMTRARAAQKKDNNEDNSDSEVEEIVNKEWWQEFCDGDELDNIRNSGKLTLLFEILKECEEIGDKILVFSQSLYSLNCIEYFLGKIDEATQAGDTEKIGFKGSWSLGLDYFRIDGSSSCDNRAYWCDSFNNPENIRARLFLISTKAGGLGINLVAANRVIIFDVSWNPSHDVQSIYRVYRFGQTKPSYIYRFVTYGAMEMKIYERQVTKQAISKRVIDEQQIDRHYNQNDLQELYKCDLEPTERPLPMVPKDVLLGEMLQKYENVIYKYHLHQSLLENKHDEGLNEEERKAAWEEFENEKVLRKTTTSTNAFFAQAYGMSGATGIQNMSAAAINAALVNIVRRDNPTWSEQQIKGIIPALVRQLQVQIEEQDMSMYQRVVQEIQIMNQARLKESLYQQQVMKLYQQQYLYQKQQQSVLGNLNINPQTLQSLYGQSNYFPDNTRQFANGPSTSSNTSRRPAGDIIELND